MARPVTGSTKEVLLKYSDELELDDQLEEDDVKPRKLRNDAPTYVRQMVERLEPFLEKAKSRRIMEGYDYWKCCWYELETLDSTQISILLDVYNEMPTNRLTISMTRGIATIRLTTNKKGREDDPLRPPGGVTGSL